MKLACPYCNKDAELTTGDYVYPHRHDLKDINVYVCWPCDAYVGTHKGTNPPKPLGTMANAELRKARKAAHAAFDPFWRAGRMRRREAYAKLSALMNLPKEKAHIAMFNVEQCKKVVEQVVPTMMIN